MGDIRFLAKEKSLRSANLRGCPFQPSSQREQEAPSLGETIAIPLNLCRILSKSLHQKKPAWYNWEVCYLSNFSPKQVVRKGY